MNYRAVEVFEEGSNELDTLINASYDIMFKTNGEIFCEVRTTYFDYGQDWKWTTIIAYDKDKEPYQALNPNEQSKILFGTAKEKSETLEKVIARCLTFMH